MSQSARFFDRKSEDAMMPLREIETMMADMAGLSPAIRNMSPLMAHPTAAAAAATAIGLGAASQMFGFFVGSMQGAFHASRRMGMPYRGFDMTTALKAYDSARMAEIGGAARDSAKEVRRTVDEVASRAATEVEGDVVDAVAKSARLANEGGKVAIGIASATADVLENTARAAVKEAVLPASQAEHVTKRALTTQDQKSTTASPAAASPVTKSSTRAPAARSKPARTTQVGSGAKPAAIAPRKIEKPASPDDLKQISGIGPKLEEVLNRLGVWTFAQIAAWSPGEVAWVDDHLQTGGRIERDDWVGGAAALSGKK